MIPMAVLGAVCDSLQLVALEVMAGLLLFLRLMVRPLCPVPLSDRLWGWARGVVRACWVVAVSALVLGMVATLDALSDETLSAVQMVPVWLHTWFGRVWIGRLLLALALGVLVWRPNGTSAVSRFPALVLALALLLSLTLVSHAAAGHGGHDYVPIGLHAAHLVATAAWVGSLPVLLMLAWQGRCGDDDWGRLVQAVMANYAVYGGVAVAVIVASGATMAWSMTQGAFSPAQPFVNVLAVKLALVVVMLGLGGFNRLVLTPRVLARAKGVLRALWCTVAVELSVGAMVVTAAAILAQTSPPA